MAAVRVIRFLRRLLDVDDTNIAVGKAVQVRAGVGSEPAFVHEYVDFPTGIDELEELIDVVFTGLANGDRLTYDQGTDTWVNTSGAAVGPHGSTHENGGLDEISIAGLDGVSTELANHLADAVDAHDATAVSVDSTTLSGVGTNVQASLEELDNLLDDHSTRHENGGADEISIAGLDGISTELANHLADATDAHDASAISNVAAGGIAATDVQAAINELDTEKVSTTTFEDHSARHENGGADEISIAGLDGIPTELQNHLDDVTDAHDASAVSVDSTSLSGTAIHVQGSLEELDNLLDDHSARHENGGADEISVAGLSGELADAQPVTIRKNTGADVGTRSRLNFIEGSNVTLTVADDAGSDEVDITIASTGGGGGTGNVFLTAAGMWPSTDSGCQVNTKLEFDTNDIDLWHLAFDQTTQEFAQGGTVLPDWDGGTFTARFYWCKVGTSTNGVVWQCAARSYGDAETIDQSWGTAQEIADTPSATSLQMHISDVTSAITAAGTPAAGQYVQFRVSRDPADGSDTLAADALLLGVLIEYTKA